MSCYFFDHGAERLDAVVRPGMLCAFDFDGTLAPISKYPEKVYIPNAIITKLSCLSRYARIAVVSGRSVEDLQSRLGFEPSHIIGNHGIEGFSGSAAEMTRYRLMCEQWQNLLAEAFQREACFDPNVWIENKTYSLSVHYRLARDPVSTEKRLSGLFESVVPDASILAGKRVFNLLPPGAANKGRALEELCEACRLPSAIYVGDDVTDEEVFKIKREDWLTVRVERCPESRAEFYLHHRLDVLHLLDTIIRRLQVHTRSA